MWKYMMGVTSYPMLLMAWLERVISDENGDNWTQVPVYYTVPM